MSALIRNLCTAATLALLAPPTLSHGAGCKLEVIELPVRMVGSRAVATVEINGTPVPLTVDSGAFYSMLTDAAAAQLGLRLRSSHGLQVNGLTGPDQNASDARRAGPTPAAAQATAPP